MSIIHGATIPKVLDVCIELDELLNEFDKKLKLKKALKE
jgi:hypothetical protein